MICAGSRRRSRSTLCGHATLAAGHILHHSGKTVRFCDPLGILTVTRDGDLLELDVPAFATPSRPTVPALRDALGCRAGEILLGDGGNDSAIVMLDDEAAVRAVRPDFAKLRDIRPAGHRHRAGRRARRRQPGVRRLSRHRRGSGDRRRPCGAGAVLGEAPRPRRASPRSRRASAPACSHCRLEGDRVVLGGRCVTVIVGQFQL